MTVHRPLAKAGRDITLDSQEASPRTVYTATPTGRDPDLGGDDRGDLSEIEPGTGDRESEAEDEAEGALYVRHASFRQGTRVRA